MKAEGTAASNTICVRRRQFQRNFGGEGALLIRLGHGHQKVLDGAVPPIPLSFGIAAFFNWLAKV